jgi:hypothetical protein
MRSYEIPEEYRSEARVDRQGSSEGLSHSPATKRRGHSVLEAVALNNVGKAGVPFRSSTTTTLAVAWTNELKFIFGDRGAVKVRDEVGHRGTQRRDVQDHDATRLHGAALRQRV